MVFYMPTVFGYLVYFRSSIYFSKKDNFLNIVKIAPNCDDINPVL